MSATGKNTILVPTDFTSIADCAIMNSLEIASKFDLNVCLLHVVSKNASNEEKQHIEDQLSRLSEKHSKKFDVRITYHIKEGSIFSAITNTVSEVSAELIVIGIHGTHKDKDILGSFAYNVICSSQVPVMVVKKCHETPEEGTIVVPVDFTQDVHPAVELSIKFASVIKCAVHVTGVLFSKSSLYDTIVSREKKESVLQKIADKIKKEGINVKADILIKPKTILVPTDFTPVAAKALEHAIELAKNVERKICLLHVIGKNTKESTKEKVEHQLKHIAEEAHKRHGVEISYLIKIGGIFDVITDTVSEISAGMMVIGFHGRQGVEHITSGFAYTVIRNSAVPVMVVKKTHLDISDNHIVVPINFPHERIEKVNKAIKFAKAFDCLVHVIGVLHINEISSKNEKAALLKSINDYLISKGVRYLSEVLIKSNSLLVPIDFTREANYAINYATEIAKKSGKNICLLNVLKENIKDSEKKDIETSLEQTAHSIHKRSGVITSFIAETGSIYDVITETASEISADLIIMGIHGKKGLQHIMGSNAFKVVKSSKVPVLVVKNDFPKNNINNIIIPLSIEHESTQKVFKAIDFARYFGSTIHLTGFLHSKGSVYKIEKEALIKNVASHIENTGIKIQSEILHVSKTNAESKFLDYANKNNADIIIVVAKRSSKFSEILGQNFAEQIIDKSDIPVLNIIPYAEFDEDETYSVGPFVDPLGLMRKE
ncbi:MAG: universal stress protein [Bacteroidetes bacterium]|nr:universal stress protein [Bacteroidota bacterium]